MHYVMPEFIIYFALILLVSPFIGIYCARVLSGERVFLSPLLSGIESVIYRIAGINTLENHSWKHYAGALIMMNAIGFIILFAILKLQAFLPLNPQHFAGLSTPLALNTAISFVTNTNWQAYSGEASLSYFSQAFGLTVQNFLSAATGLAVMVALIRGITQKQTRSLGNFYVDLTRSTLYILLPLAIISGIVLMSQGVPQNLSHYISADTVENAKQVLPQGPVASQIAIKQLGSNGGGFFGTNSAHPYENPTPLSNFVQMLLILLLPAALPFTYGAMVKDMRQGWTIFGAMFVVLLAGVTITYFAEAHGNPLLAHTALQGKEVRFGVAESSLWAALTTASSNGSVNAMLDSYSPIGGMIAMVNMMLGEVIFGGVGAGMYGMIIFVILTVFIAGLMVGRSPEYLGKKIEAREITLAIISLLAVPIGILGLGALATILPASVSSVSNPGPHGLSQILYAYTSATGNNGSAFGGFGADTPYQNIMLSIAMLIGRFMVILPILAIAGSLSEKKIIPSSSGTFPTHGLQFAALLIGIILIVGGLTFFPVLTLGPVLEHFSLMAGHSF